MTNGPPRDPQSGTGEPGEPARTPGDAERIASLEEAVQARDEFISIAGHELRNPLSAISLQTQLLLRMARTDEPVDPAALRKRLDALYRQVQRFERRTLTLLDLSRITAGRFTIEVETVDLAALLNGVIEAHRGEIESARVSVRLHLTTGVVGQWDASALDQVASNVLSNAIKFGAGGVVDVRVARENGEAVLSVRDGGPGISPEDQARIFEPFERAVRRRETGGFGLGLWITRNLVEALGGTIRVASEPGRGTEFTVRLPLDATGEEGAE